MREFAFKYPAWAEFWIELSYLETQAKDHYKATAYAFLAKDLPIAPTQLFRETNMYTDQPYRVASWSLEHLGAKDLALKLAKDARTFIGEHDSDWEDRITRLEGKGPEKKIPEKKIEPPRQASICLLRPGAMGDILMTLNLSATRGSPRRCGI